jgi:hypothetical protein
MEPPGLDFYETADGSPVRDPRRRYSAAALRESAVRARFCAAWLRAPASPRRRKRPDALAPGVECAPAERRDASGADMSGSRTSAQQMTADEALAWLRQVDGELYRTPRGGDRAAWVAVVRTPRAAPRTPRLIVALGESLEEATATAARQWREELGASGFLH